jgi:Protein of unknown function (DUF2490)
LRNFYFQIFLILAMPLCALAGTGYKPTYADAGSWNTLNLTYKVNAKWGLLFTQEFRLRENYSRLNLFYTNVGVNYAVNKQFKIGVIYRLIDKYLEDNTFSFRHRFMNDYSYKFDYKKWGFGLRQRFQIEWRDVYSSELGLYPELFSRTKAEVSFDVTPKLSPYISTEFRAQFTDPRNNADDDNLSRNRTIFGCNYVVNDAIKVGAYFLHQAEFNTITPQIINILGLECNLNINKLFASKSKKKK